MRRTGCPPGGLANKPVERYALDRDRIQYLPPGQYAEDEARQRGDGASPEGVSRTGCPLGGSANNARSSSKPTPSTARAKPSPSTIDDAHLMPPPHLRKLRLLIEETPGNYAVILFAQTELLARLALAVNEDLRSRVSYSALLRPLAPEDIEAFILRELDRCGLAHSRIDTAALRLIAASCGGILRHAVNLTTAALIQTVRTQTTTTTTHPRPPRFRRSRCCPRPR